MGRISKRAERKGLFWRGRRVLKVLGVDLKFYKADAGSGESQSFNYFLASWKPYALVQKMTRVV